MLQRNLNRLEKVTTESLPTPLEYDDADTEISEVEEECESEGETSEEDDDDSEELLRELEKIKREREELKRKELQEKEREIINANPLLNLDGDDAGFAVKRRWDDDVIFKNQTAGVNDKPKKRFINDTTRSDFHRKFLDKYVQ